MQHPSLPLMLDTKCCLIPTRSSKLVSFASRTRPNVFVHFLSPAKVVLPGSRFIKVFAVTHRHTEVTLGSITSRFWHSRNHLHYPLFFHMMSLHDFCRNLPKAGVVSYGIRHRIRRVQLNGVEDVELKRVQWFCAEDPVVISQRHKHCFLRIPFFAPWMFDIGCHHRCWNYSGSLCHLSAL